MASGEIRREWIGERERERAKEGFLPRERFVKEDEFAPASPGTVYESEARNALPFEAAGSR